MAQKFLSIKNFEKYQHYKHRNPPWIKLHLELLDDVDFLRMPDASKWHYVGLLLLASRHENAIQSDADYIKNRLGLTEKIDTTSRFIRDHVLARKASRPLANKIELGGSETETETENSSRAVATTTRGRRPSAPKSSETWEAYSDAYRSRYGADPVRNAKVNSILSQLVQRLGSVEAPAVAAFYLSHNNAFYVQRRHPVDILLRDAEGLRTEWITGVKSTRGEAKAAETRDEAVAQIERVRAMMAAKGR